MQQEVDSHFRGLCENVRSTHWLESYDEKRMALSNGNCHLSDAEICGEILYPATDLRQHLLRTFPTRLEIEEQRLVGIGGVVESARCWAKAWRQAELEAQEFSTAQRRLFERNPVALFDNKLSDQVTMGKLKSAIAGRDALTSECRDFVLKSLSSKTLSADLEQRIHELQRVPQELRSYSARLAAARSYDEWIQVCDKIDELFRSDTDEAPPPSYLGLALDQDNRLSRQGSNESVVLTPLEAAVMAKLIDSGESFCPKDSLANAWDLPASPEQLDKMISSLRKKISQLRITIETRKNVGRRLVVKC